MPNCRSEHAANTALASPFTARRATKAQWTAVLQAQPVPPADHEHRAREIARTLGLPRAAGYLRNRGVPPERAVQVLLAA